MRAATVVVRVLTCVGVSVALILGGHSAPKRASATTPPPRKVILINGIPSSYSCGDSTFANDFSPIINSLEAQPGLGLTDRDFLGLSYADYGGASGTGYCDVPGSNAGILSPSYTVPNTCIGLSYPLAHLDWLISEYPINTKFDIVGHSMGGVVAAYYAITGSHRAQVRSVITLDSPLQGLNPLQAGLAGTVFNAACGSSQSIADLATGSTYINLIQGSAAGAVLFATARNEADLEVTPDMAHVSGPWKDRVFFDACDVTTLNHNCVMHDADGLALIDQAVLGTECGTIFSNVTWDTRTIHAVTCGVTVAPGATLSVAAGTIVKFNDGTGIRVEGALTASGATGNPVYFTSANDCGPEVGGNTNNGGCTPGPSTGSWWAGLHIDPTDTAGSISLDHADVRYGGYGTGGLIVNSSPSGSLSVTSSLLKNGQHAAIRLDGLINTGTYTIADDIPTGNGLNGVYVSSVAGDATLHASNTSSMPYVADSLTVPVYKTLAVEPGTIVKFNDGGGIRVSGTLTVAGGNSGNRTIFTSINDCPAGGNTNSGGCTPGPSTGSWWAGLHIDPTDTTGSINLDYADVRYGGYGTGGLVVNSSPSGTLSLTNSSFKNSESAGVRIVGSNNNAIGGIGDGNIITANGGSGVSIVAGVGNQVLGNSIYGNGAGEIVLSAGANNGQAAPSPIVATSNGTSATVSAILSSAPATIYRVEFFSTPTCDVAPLSGPGQGQTFLGASNAATTSNGSVVFTQSLPASVTLGQVVTMTATNPTNDTSAFSSCAVVRSPCPNDSDCDGYTDAQEIAIGSNPHLYCPIMRADINMSGKVTLADLILLAQQYNNIVPPAPARYDQNFDGKITLADLILVAQVYNQPVTACP